MAESLGKAVLELEADGGRFSKNLGSAHKQANSFVGSVGRGFARVGKIAAYAAGAAGIGAIAVTLKRGFSEASESARVMAQTEAVLKSTGGTANMSAKEIEGLASSLSKLTGVDDENIQAGENWLLTFKNIRNEAGAGNDIFTQLTATTLDVAAAQAAAHGTTIDMATASTIMGKAFNDPIKGMTALTRVGVGFTAAQMETIKALVKSGDLLGAQKLMLKEIKSQVEGSAKAYGDTFPGQLAKLRNSFDELAGQMFGAVVPALRAGAERLSAFFDKIGDAKGAEAKLRVVVDGLKSFGGEVLSAVKKSLGAIPWGKVWESVQITAQGLVDKFHAALGATNWQAVGKGIGTAIVKAVAFADDLAAKLTKELAKAASEVDWVQFARGLGKGLIGTGGISSQLQNAFLKLNPVMMPLRVEMKLLKAAGSSNKGVAELRAAVESDLRYEFARLKLPRAQIDAGMRALAEMNKFALIKAVDESGTMGIASAIARKVREGAEGARGAASTAGAGVGAAAVTGIVGYIQYWSYIALANVLAAKIRAAVAAAGAAMSGSGPWEFTRHAVGEPMAEGVISGFVSGIGGWAKRGAASINTLIEKTAKLVEAAKGRFETAWGVAMGDAMSALAGIQGATETPTEKLLRQMQEGIRAEDEARELAAAQTEVASSYSAVARAQGELNAAQAAGVDSDVLAEKERALAEARDANTAAGDRLVTATRAIATSALEAKAAMERKDEDARNEAAMRALGEAANKLMKHLMGVPHTADQAMKETVEFLRKHKIKFEGAGSALGAAFVTMFKKSIAAAAGASGEIAAIELSKVAASIKVPKLDRGGTVLRSGLAVVHRGETFSGVGGGGGWPERIVLELDGRQVAEVVRADFYTTDRQNDGLGWRAR